MPRLVIAVMNMPFTHYFQDIARCMVPQPERPGAYVHALNIAELEIGSNEVARLNGTWVKKAAEFR